MKRSRINTHLKQQSSRNIFIALSGIVIIIILIMTFGMNLLVNFSLLVKNSTNPDFKKNELSYVAPPILNPMNEATGSAKIIISGYAEEKQTIKLFVNGKLVDKETVNKDKQFSFSDVQLDKGENEIKAQAETENNKKSNYSNSINITYIDSPPSLEINSPQDGQSVSKDPLKVTGKTNPNIKITINDFWVIVEDDGSFSHLISVHDGDNNIKIVATDDAGNQTTKEIKVNAH